MKMSMMTKNETGSQAEMIMNPETNNGWNGGGAAVGRPGLPKDLTDWIGGLTLIRQTLDAVVKTDPATHAQSRPQNYDGCRPEMLLTLLTYAYARGILGSRELELAIPNDRALRYICAGKRPDWQLLRRFRRQNQARLQACLANVLQGAWETQYPSKPQAPENSYAEAALDRWLNPPAPDFAAEAGRRLRLAIQSDTLMVDE